MRITLPLLLLIGLSSTMTASCKDNSASQPTAAPPREAPQPETAGPAAKPALHLGGGYQEVKWGTVRAEAKRLLKGKVKEDRADSIVFTVDNGKEVTAYFNEGKLFRVHYEPMLEDSDENRALLLTAISDKFGKPTKEFDGHTTFLDAEIPTHTYVWEDEDMSIEMTNKFFRSVTSGVANSTVVNYYNNAMQQKFEDQRDAKRNVDESKKKSDALKSMKSGL